LTYAPLGHGFLTGQVTKLEDVPKGDIRHMFGRFQPEVSKWLSLLVSADDPFRSKSCPQTFKTSVVTFPLLIISPKISSWSTTSTSLPRAEASHLRSLHLRRFTPTLTREAAVQLSLFPRPQLPSASKRTAMWFSCLQKRRRSLIVSLGRSMSPERDKLLRWSLSFGARLGPCPTRQNHRQQQTVFKARDLGEIMSS
jgi:hypothetical protein